MIVNLKQEGRGPKALSMIQFQCYGLNVKIATLLAKNDAKVTWKIDPVYIYTLADNDTLKYTVATYLQIFLESNDEKKQRL